VVTTLIRWITIDLRNVRTDILRTHPHFPKYGIFYTNNLLQQQQHQEVLSPHPLLFLFFGSLVLLYFSSLFFFFSSSLFVSFWEQLFFCLLGVFFFHHHHRCTVSLYRNVNRLLIGNRTTAATSTLHHLTLNPIRHVISYTSPPSPLPQRFRRVTPNRVGQEKNTKRNRRNRKTQQKKKNLQKQRKYKKNNSPQDFTLATTTLFKCFFFPFPSFLFPT